MGNIKKGDLVRFTEWALDPKRIDAHLCLAFLRNENLNEVHTIASVNPDTTVFLEGRGEVQYENYWFERVCCICEKEEVFKQMRKFDKCLPCAKKYRDEMYEKVRAALSPKLLTLFDEFYKADEDSRSMELLR